MYLFALKKDLDGKSPERIEFSYENYIHINPQNCKIAVGSI